MTIVAAALAVALVAVVWSFLRHISQIEARNVAERSELADRIQAPDRLPVRLPDQVDVPVREPDGWGHVGAVRVTQEWIDADG